MNKIKLALALVATSSGLILSSPALAEENSADSSTRLVMAREIIDVSYPENARYELFSKAADQMETQMQQSLQPLIQDEGAMDIVRNFQDDVRQDQKAILIKHVPLLMEAWTQAYAELFSEKELTDILAFVKTDTGRSFMIRSADVLGNRHFASANQDYMNEAMSLVMTKMPSLVEKLTAYKEAQKTER